MSEGRLRETYVAAVQHDLADLSGGERLVGVVRRPTGWFRAAVDENRRALGPPDDLLSEVQARHEEFERRGMCDEGALNAAWEETDFADRYRAYLDESDGAQEAMADLLDAVRDGQEVVLVCYEGENKRCHRHVLKDRLESRLE